VEDVEEEEEEEKEEEEKDEEDEEDEEERGGGGGGGSSACSEYPPCLVAALQRGLQAPRPPVGHRGLLLHVAPQVEIESKV